MSLQASCGSQKRPLCSLLAGRSLKKPRLNDGERLQEAAVLLLDQNQNLCRLFQELQNMEQNRNPKQNQAVSDVDPLNVAGLLVVSELRRQADRRGVAVGAVSVKTMLDRLDEIAGRQEDKLRQMFTSSQRVQLQVLLEASKLLLCQGAFCPRLLWAEYRRDQKHPHLELLYFLHLYNILTLDFIIESDDAVASWLPGQLKALCCWTPPQEEEETRQVQQEVLSTVVGVLVASVRSSVLDELLLWFLDIKEECDEGAERWIQTLDASLCGGSVSPEALQRFFAHCLTQIFTWNPKLTVSDAVTLQNDWTVAKAGRCLTSLCCKLAAIFSVEQLLHHLQQVLETHEVNWKHVLVFVSTLLVYDQSAQSNLSEALCRLLSSAFGGYDLEKLITAFLLARQGALEGTGVFPSYTDWFKMSFGGRSGFHAGSKKSLVFLLKFLSDLVPFEPPQYLKVHILHPPFVPPKHRSLLMEYVTLAKTRLADLQESVEDMGLYEDASAAGASSLQSQAAQDVEKAVCLFESSGRIPAAVMEASIFRRPYFLTRFLPALLKPRAVRTFSVFVRAVGTFSVFVRAVGTFSVFVRAVGTFSVFVRAVGTFSVFVRAVGTFSVFVRAVGTFRGLSRFFSCFQLPLEADAQMNFIEVLKQAEKIPAAQYSQYVESCQKRRQQSGSPRRPGAPLAVLQEQLQEFTQLLAAGRDPESLGLLSRISLTLSVICPGSDDPVGSAATPSLPDLHLKVVDLILRSFCQSLLVASRGNPPNRQSEWGSRFVCLLLDNRQLLSSVIHRLKDLFHRQAASLKPAHILGLAAFIVHLQAAQPGPAQPEPGPAQPEPGPAQPGPVPVEEALDLAMLSSSRNSMLLSVRLAVAAVSYGLCRGHSASPQRLQDFIPRSLYKKVLYLVPRLFPEARIRPERQDGDGPTSGHLGDDLALLWSFNDGTSWSKLVLHLWRHAAFQQLQQLQQYQLCFSEWLHEELRVQRNSDVLSDAERHQYQQWACWELYLPRPEEQGGCGGDPRALCSRLLTAIMEPPPREMNLENLDFSPGSSGTGTCLPDLLSRLQELVYEAQVGELWGRRVGLGDFLLRVVAEKCAASSSSVSTRLSLQRTMETWNRVLLALPPVMFFKIKTEAGQSTVDCSELLQHITQLQRKACPPASALPCAVTVHLLKGLLFAAGQCGHPAAEVDRVWSLMSASCPLLLVSAVRWWQQISPVLVSLWTRLQDAEPFPEQLQLLSTCRLWACSLRVGPVLVQIPPGPVLVQAASLHGAFRGGAECQQNFREVLDGLREAENQQVLVSLLFLFVTDFLSELLDPQEKSSGRSKWFCSELLGVLVHSAEWLLLFGSNEPDLELEPDPVTLTVSDVCSRLMPWAVCSLLQQQSAAFHQRALRCPGFLHSTTLWYLAALRLFLDGEAPASACQAEPTRVLDCIKQFVLSLIQQAPAAAMSCSQWRQLETRCADLDPELAASLSVHLDHTRAGFL
ncbi:Fanconi anemia group A protein-like isoform X2 [Poeciliopsis prolifica]|uniref:Fanconi anemia group A protein-like isoform X2 n=1 Tax=Poeciliopsis prolifica TaxID=188132 RepID=UPI00241381F2|nr:Fanconi anemia group A protein-like isoform X2 [Poeciliopsis prolifica]